MISMILTVAAGRPYFGTAAAAFQSPPVRHAYMQALIAHLARRRSRPLEVLEVGSWAGASAITWARALAAHGGGTVTCVDPWQPYFDLSENGSRAHYRRMNEAAASGDVLALFHHNVRVCGVADRIETIRGRSADILPGLPSQSFDVVYLDGSHRYEDVLADLRLGMRLVRRGGVVCGDDLEAQRSELDDEGVRLMLESSQDFIRRGAAGPSFHPGVTRAVSEVFGEVSAWEGFWAMRRSGGRWQPLDLSAEKIEVPEHLCGTATAGSGPPQTIGTLLDRNLVMYDGSVLAIPRRLDAVDPDLVEDSARPADEATIVSSDTVDGAILRVQISELEMAVAPLGGRVRDLGEGLGSVRSDLSLVRSELGAFEGAVSAVASIAEPVANRMLSVESEIEELRSELVDTAAAFAAAQEPLLPLPEQVAELARELRSELADTAATFAAAQEPLLPLPERMAEIDRELRSELADTAATFAAAQEPLLPLPERVAEIDRELRSELADTAAAFAAAQEPLLPLPERVAELARELRSAHTDIVLLGQNTMSVQARIDRVADEMGPLAPALAQVGSAVEMLDPRLDTLHAEVSSLARTVARLEGMVGDLLGRTEILQDLNAKSDDLARGLGAVGAVIVTVRDQLAPLTASVPALEARVRPLRSLSLLLRPFDAALARLAAVSRALLRRVRRWSGARLAGEAQPASQSDGSNEDCK